jgi:UDP-2-acetamido-3-amino-2,3-dideoxy-glucuronate N-acetyltransferase
MIPRVIDPTAIVDLGARVDSEATIWQFCHVCAGATIGPGASIGQNCYVGPNVWIAANVRIQNNVSVYEGVVIDADVFVGPSAVFTNVRNPRMDRRTPSTAYAKTRVQRGATIGANATLVAPVTVGVYAFVAAGSVVTHDVEPYRLVGGVPSEPIGYVCRCGYRLDDLQIVGAEACRHCGRWWRLDLDGLVETLGRRGD